MPETINYEMSTEYNPDFKNQLDYKKLYDLLDDMYKGYKEDDDKIFSSKDHFTRTDCGIRSNLKKLLNLNLKDYYDKSDDEGKFKVLKLMYFLGCNDFDNHVSIIKLLSEPSIEHIDRDNSVYQKDFTECISEIRKGVENHTKIESTISTILKLFDELISKLWNLAIRDLYTKEEHIEVVLASLKIFLNETKNSTSMYWNKNGPIEAFYTIALSKRCIAEVENFKNNIYSSFKSYDIPAEITTLLKNEFFESYMTWDEFSKNVNLKLMDINDVQTELIWKVLLLNPHVTQSDIDNIKTYIWSYNFAFKNAQKIASYWSEESETNQISVFTWIVVMQELIDIHKSKIKYSNYFHAYCDNGNNPKPTLSSAIKSFDEKSDVPKAIIKKRLFLRNLKLLGLSEKLNSILEAEKAIYEFQNHVLSFHDVTYINLFGKQLYCYLLNYFTVPKDVFGKIYSITENINSHIKEVKNNNDIPQIMIDIQYTPNNIAFAQLLSEDSRYSLMHNEQFMSIRSQLLEYIVKLPTSENKQELCNKIIKLRTSINSPVDSGDIFAKEFAEEIIKLYEVNSDDNCGIVSTRIFEIPCTIEDELKGICYVSFEIYKKQGYCIINKLEFAIN